ncbi:G1/S-specific cyclin-E1 [Leptodactylus fuscus]|uniref:G1/S-specific cyclin-E1 n=1 Tax=Leptodactylus fuscus TaxID=238119 RepID=UPI003F4E722D
MPNMSNYTKDNHTKDEGTAEHSRKRKADVAIFLQDPDENLELELIEMIRKKQYAHRGNWRNCNSWKSPYKLIPTPEKEAGTLDVAPYQYCGLKFRSSVVSPLPQLSWADSDYVWRNMLCKESTYPRDRNLLQRHPELGERMRSILLDWLTEVSEVYKLHRETLYLAQDFFDRFMATQENIVKNQLQLIGITTLFIAAKLEEIYPPKLHQFAYITDGACTEDEIVNMELIIMKALNWRLSPLTAVFWLNVYLQVAYIRELQKFLIPQYPQHMYLKTVQLLDLCILDVEFLEYPYSILAASVLYYFSNAELVINVSGYEWTELEPCINHVLPFVMTLREAGIPSHLKYFKGVDIENLHNIQTYTGYMDLLEKAQAIKGTLKQKLRVTPVSNGILTPPLSDKKEYW